MPSMAARKRVSLWRQHRLLALCVLLTAAAFVTLGCSATPPPRWQAGGAPLVIAPAHWDRANGDSIDIKANGQVLENGDQVLFVDRAGRVTDENYDPVAILLPDGYVAGTDNRSLGRVGVTNAAPPGSATAWLSILPNGQVVRFNADGDRENGGVWHGCNGPQMRTCTLVTHILLVQSYANRPTPSVGIGIGIGL